MSCPFWKAGLFALTVLALGCGGTKAPPLADGGTPDGGPQNLLTITTASLPDGVAQDQYSSILSADGGSPPLTWTLVSASSGFEWLALAPQSGELYGVPSSVQAGQVVVQVSDGHQAAKATLSLRIDACSGTDTTPCALNPDNGAACFIGFHTCVDGVYGDCHSTGDYSADVKSCGANCTSCGVTGDHCAQGQCACADMGRSCTGDETCCADGCATTDTDPQHCGGCDNNCVDPGHTTPTCASGSCEFTCTAPYANCDHPDAGTQQGTDTNGCETNISNDPANCGACGALCGATHTTSSVCQGGACQLACQPHFDNCDNNPSNGCEVSLSSDPDNCNACGAPCPLRPNEAERACVNSICQIGACKPGYRNCNSLEGDGCEVHTDADPAQCGACGNVCPGTTNGSATCSNGTCGLACNPGYILCGNQCVSELSNSSCGACGNVCDTNLQRCARNDQGTAECCDYDCTTLPCQTFCF